jgi:hypothetical protein
MYYPVILPVLAWSSAAFGLFCELVRMRSRSGRRRRQAEFAAMLLFATALALGGTTGLLFNLRAPHLTADGVVYDVRSIGTHGQQRQFNIFTRPESAEPFELSWDNPHIRDGQLARVTWQAGSHRLLSVEVLYGPEQRYRTTQRDGTTGSLYCLGGALILVLFGCVRWFSTVAAEERRTAAATAEGTAGLHLSSPPS